MIILTPQAIGLALKEARRHQGLTQEQLAALAGVGVRFVRAVEAGKPSCHLGKVLLLLQTAGLMLRIQASP